MIVEVKMWKGPRFQMTVHSKAARQNIGKVLSRGCEFDTRKKVRKYLEKCTRLMGYGTDISDWDIVEY